MLLGGSIQRFGLSDILQFLATKNATGALGLQHVDKRGVVNLVNGCVENILLSYGNERIGVRLIRAGCLDEQQLSEILCDHAQATSQGRKLPLGERLKDSGIVEEKRVREAMVHQTLDRLVGLLCWKDGEFVYEEPANLPRFEIAIECDVQELLLEAHARFDEATLIHGTQGLGGDPRCRGCPLDGQCTPAIKSSYLRSDLCLWRKVRSLLNESGSIANFGPSLSGPEGSERRATLVATLTP
jgi:hypothetical protein